MAQWYYSKSGQKSGPVDPAELKRLAASGQLSPTDQIWQKGLKAWIPASQVKGLFPVAVPPTLSDQPPKHGRRDRGDAAAPRTAVSFEKSKEPQDVIGHQRWILWGGIGVSALLVATALVWFLAIPVTREESHGKGEQQMASVKAQVTGGAWLTKTAGNSEPLRGLTIYFIRHQATNVVKVAILQAQIEDTKTSIDIGISKTNKNVLEISEKMDELIDGPMSVSALRDSMVARKEEFIKEQTDFLKVATRVFEVIIEKAEKQTEIAKSAITDSIDTRELFSLKASDIESTAIWEASVLGDAVAEAHTDVDGKYSIEVPGGRYYAYARNDSANSTVEWLIPVKVIDSKNISIDFHNDTAERIKNKK